MEIFETDFNDGLAS